MDDKIRAAIVFMQKLGGNPKTEFSRKQRVRRPPGRIDDKSTNNSIFQFHGYSGWNESRLMI